MLSEEKFWEIIENSDQGRNLIELINALSDDELIGFRYWWDYFSHKLYRQDLWAAAYIVRGGCSDDSFEYFRNWLILQGRQAVYNALQNADSLCDLFEKTDCEDPEDEEANYIVMEEIERRADGSEDFREKLEQSEMPPFPGDIEFKWEEDDEESIRAVCPRIFDRFWDAPPALAAQLQSPLPATPTKKGFLAKLIGLFTGRR